jgi:hypothetical protein
MLVARRSFVATYDGREVAVHRGRTRVAERHELALRFPLRFEKVNMREDARSRFRDQLDTAETYDDYVRMLDEMTARLRLVQQRGEMRVTAPDPRGEASPSRNTPRHASPSSRRRAPKVFLITPP